MTIGTVLCRIVHTQTRVLRPKYDYMHILSNHFTSSCRLARHADIVIVAQAGPSRDPCVEKRHHG